MMVRYKPKPRSHKLAGIGSHKLYQGQKFTDQAARARASLQQARSQRLDMDTKVADTQIRTGTGLQVSEICCIETWVNFPL